MKSNYNYKSNVDHTHLHTKLQSTVPKIYKNSLLTSNFLSSLPEIQGIAVK